ncbi:MAG: AI-2E family transporter [Eubacteriales bacterium]|nr:AI-2E family transporter [Eubacteriales bacterium]
MKESMKKYFGWGATIVIAGGLTLLIFFCIYKFGALAAGIKKLINILMPVIVGIGIAYVLSPAYNWARRKFQRLFYYTFHWRGRRAIQWAAILAMVCTFVGAGALICGLLALIIPQIITSISSMAVSLPNNLMNLSNSLQRLLRSNPELEEQAMSLYAQAINYAEEWIQNSIAPSIQDALGYVSIGVMNTVSFLKNFFIGIIVAVYLLAGQQRFMRGIKRCIYAIFDVHWGNIITEYAHYANQTFTGFIGGKLLDSFIIFLICCVVLPIMNMPYAMLISVIVGVTNIIPFFGPFIGAIPSFIIIFIADPLKSLYFLIYVLILQQFDGNILGPKILGNSTGLSSFWVLFAILLFGGLFGFAGMLLGVPVFAVLYHILTDIITRALKDKELPEEAADYAWLDHIDESSHVVVHRAMEKEDKQAAEAMAQPAAEPAPEQEAPDGEDK